MYWLCPQRNLCLISLVDKANLYLFNSESQLISENTHIVPYQSLLKARELEMHLARNLESRMY